VKIIFNITGYGCQRSALFVTVALTWGIFCSVERVKDFVNIHLRCIQGRTRVGTRGNGVPTPFCTKVTLLEDLGFSFQFLRLADGEN